MACAAAPKPAAAQQKENDFCSWQVQYDGNTGRITDIKIVQQKSKEPGKQCAIETSKGEVLMGEKATLSTIRTVEAGGEFTTEGTDPEGRRLCKRCYFDGAGHLTCVTYQCQ